MSERDVCTKFITPAVIEAGWDRDKQVREEVSFTAGKILVYGKIVKRGVRKRADYILYHKPNMPIALIEAKEVSGVFYSEHKDSDSIVVDTRELSFIKYSLWDDCDEY